MKFTRIPDSSSIESKEVLLPSSRGDVLLQDSKTQKKVGVAEISKKVAGCCADDDGPVLRLEDEFDASLVALVVEKCRGMISESSMTREDWNKIGEFLGEELWEFSRLKEDLVKTERKWGMVKQRAGEITEAAKTQSGEELNNRLMACAMLLAETEMRRDHLSARVAMIIDQFTAGILSDFRGRASYVGLELRLRAVFGSL